MAKPYPRNPRTLTKQRATELESSLARLGDLGGIVHNLTDDTIVGGNQRMRIFGERTDTVIVAQNEQPDQQGTVAHGFIVWRGNRYAYRQVKWDEATAREANIRANLQAGEWDWQELAAWDTVELKEWGFDDARLREWNNDALNLREMQTADGVANSNSHQSLSDRFIVPPFSVLDARQGYWQDRKRAWLSLGIQSELGRGENLQGMSKSNGVKMAMANDPM